MIFKVKIVTLLNYFTIISFILSCKEAETIKKPLFIKEELQRLDLDAYESEEAIPTDSCAAQIAEVLLKRYFGNEIEAEKPLRVCLFQDSIWIIKGNFPRNNYDWRGGVAHIELRKSDAKVLRIYHGK